MNLNEKMRRIRPLARLGGSDAQIRERLKQIRDVVDAEETGPVRQERAGYDRGSPGASAPVTDPVTPDEPKPDKGYQGTEDLP